MGACTPATLIDEWRRALVLGHLTARDPMKGTLRGGLLYWGTQKMRFLRDIQNAL
jgi:hypothetical protein